MTRSRLRGTRAYVLLNVFWYFAAAGLRVVLCFIGVATGSFSRCSDLTMKRRCWFGRIACLPFVRQAHV
jgi:hypothetical protein